MFFYVFYVSMFAYTNRVRPYTLLLCISLFCIFLLYRTDPQVEVLVVILREIESIEFECNEFVLVLAKIDLIHFEH